MKNQNRNKRKILLIGPRIKNGEPFGGTKVSFENQIKYFSSYKEYKVDILDISRPIENKSLPYKIYLNIIKFGGLISKIIFSQKKYDITIINISATAALNAGAILYILLRNKSKILLYRYFGGDFDYIYQNLNPISKFVIRSTTFKSNLVLLQTKKLANKYIHLGETFWYPTTRDIYPIEDNKKKTRSKIIYVGHINSDKGIDKLIELATFLPDFDFEIYGPLVDLKYEKLFKSMSNVDYLGIVDSSKIPYILSSSDFLILPSKRVAEGYPGVIIEAFQCNIPVIVSKLPSLIELVDSGVDGLVYDMSDLRSISDDVKYYMQNLEEYSKLKNGASIKGNMFRTIEVNDRLINRIDLLLQKL